MDVQKYFRGVQGWTALKHPILLVFQTVLPPHNQPERAPLDIKLRTATPAITVTIKLWMTQDTVCNSCKPFPLVPSSPLQDTSLKLINGSSEASIEQSSLGYSLVWLGMKIISAGLVAVKIRATASQGRAESWVAASSSSCSRRIKSTHPPIAYFYIQT